MAVWIDLARVAAVLNVALLLGLTSVWTRNYRRHGAQHTLGLLVFGVFLLVENGLWIYFYVFHDGYVAWLAQAGTDVQVGSMLLCGLEFVALSFVAWITWR